MFAGRTAIPPISRRQPSRPPSSATASNPISLSCRAARALVASSGHVQYATIAWPFSCFAAQSAT